MAETTVTADARIYVTRELLARLLQLPDGWRVAGLATPNCTDTVISVDVVFPDGPLADGYPLGLAPHYQWVDDANHSAGIRLTSMEPMT